jgi:ribose 5-phosphate isomerase B
LTVADQEPLKSTEALTLPDISSRFQAIALSNDHAGFDLKSVVRAVLEGACERVIDVGAQSASPVDFPDVTAAAAELLLSGEAERAVLICGTGAGACIAANKIPGLRAAVCHDTYVARQAVVHDDVNVLCIGAWIIGPEIAVQVVREFLDSAPSGAEAFRRRVAKLERLERLTPESAADGLRAIRRGA